MENSSTDSINVRKSGNCVSCKVTGAVSLFLVAAYFYYGCRHVKPVYYVGTPIMISLAISRAFDLPPFKN